MDTLSELQTIYYERMNNSRSRGERKYDHINTVDLYKKFDDLNEKFNEEKTLLHIAAQNSDLDAVKYLLDAGAKANVFDSGKATPLHLFIDNSDNFIMTDEKTAEMTTVLLDAGVSPLRKAYGRTCYHMAAEKGLYPVIDVLAKRGVNLSMTTDYGDTALHLAVGGISNKSVEFKSAVNAYEKLKDNNLLDKSNAGELVHKYDIDRYNNAVKKTEAYQKVLLLLLNAGLDPQDENGQGRKPEDIAKDKDLGDIVLILKGEYNPFEDNADSSVKLKIDAAGKTLQQACRDSDIKALKALIELGEDVNSVMYEIPFNGFSPLDVACMSLEEESVGLLIKAGADVNQKSGENAHTPVYAMTQYAAYRLMPKGKPSKDSKTVNKILVMLKNAGLNIDGEVNDDSDTALIAASRPVNNQSGVNRAVFDFLIDEGASVNKTNVKGETPLMAACEELDEDIIMTLLENGAKTDVQDKYGRTPLMHLALSRASRQAKGVALMMADFGDLNIKAVGMDGKSVMDIAAETDNEWLVKYILENMGA